MPLCYAKDAVILLEQVFGEGYTDEEGGWGWPQHPEPILWRGLRPGALVTSASGWGWGGSGVGSPSSWPGAAPCSCKWVRDGCFVNRRCTNNDLISAAYK